MMVPPRIHSSKSFFSRLSSHLSSHRHLSSLAANSKGIFHPPTRDQVARAHLSLRHMWIRSARLYQLEDEANTNPKDAKLQAEYLEAVVDGDPEYVVKRVESQRYAFNQEVLDIYRSACKVLQIEPHSAFAVQRDTFGRQQQQQQFGDGIAITSDLGGSSKNPLHAIVYPKKKSMMEKAGNFLGKAFYILFIVSLIAFAIQFLQNYAVKGASKQMAQRFSPDNSVKKFSFADVEGVDEAKEEIKEIVEFLRNPQKFLKMGVKLPTGVLLVGPPGTGKTLLAKAVAGEANVPFLFASGSEFDEMFVGVGSSRMKNLFKTARELKPCVIFIDELDAVGGKRTTMPQYPYSRMTLNQLLVEMDGYKELEGVVVIGATNLPEALDKALTRPGRFDTTVALTYPDVKGRWKILKVHAKKLKLNDPDDLKTMARNTSGFTGADLANLLNQAALRACVKDRHLVHIEDMEFAREKIMMGRERRSAVIPEEVRENTAYHEAGHALVALLVPGARPIYKATIIPRGQALGMVSYEMNDILSQSKKQILAMIDICLAGQLGEEIVFGEENINSGGSHDFKMATKYATAMVTRYGMSKLGKLSVDPEKCGPSMRKLIDEEISRILNESYDRTKKLLQENSVAHKRLAKGLLKYETLDVEEIKQVIAGKTLKRVL